MRLVFRLLISILFAGFYLEVSIVGRFGNIASSSDFSDSKTETSINSNFGITINGADSSSGDLGDTGWTSGYSYGNDQNIDVTNNSIQVSATLSASAGHDDQGVAKISADNRVTLVFENTSASLFKLEGHPNIGNGTYRLEAFDGSQWSDLYNGLAGPIDLTFQMDPGTYRITALTFLPEIENFSNSDTYSVTLTAVPEPSTVAVLSVVTAGGYFYRRRAKQIA